jgi:hypothetical protein
MTGQKIIVFEGSFNRPANVTPYTAEDAVNDGTNELVCTFDARAAGIKDNITVEVKSVKISTNNATVTAGSFRAMLRDVTQTAIADNSPQTLLYANRTKRCGYADLVLETGGAGSDSAEAIGLAVSAPMVLIDPSIYVDVIAKDAYVPASGQSFFVEITCVLISQNN